MARKVKFDTRAKVGSDPYMVRGGRLHRRRLLLPASICRASFQRVHQRRSLVGTGADAAQVATEKYGITKPAISSSNRLA